MSGIVSASGFESAAYESDGGFENRRASGASETDVLVQRQMQGFLNELYNDDAYEEVDGQASFDAYRAGIDDLEFTYEDNSTDTESVRITWLGDDNASETSGTENEGGDDMWEELDNFLPDSDQLGLRTRAQQTISKLASVTSRTMRTERGH